MLSHVHVGVTDFPRAFAFYQGVMDELGFVLKFSEPEKPWAGWMRPGFDRPLFLVGRPYNGERASVGNGQMVALLAPNRAAVDRCYARPIASGAAGRRQAGAAAALSRQLLWRLFPRPRRQQTLRLLSRRGRRMMVDGQRRTDALSHIPSPPPVIRPRSSLF
jgi:catechol 2,3-dioxygenase-like lactoylglutathione lyase family enzyme